MTDQLLVSLPQACIWTNLARLGLPAACVIERSIEILVMIFEVSYSCMEAALIRARILVSCFGAGSLNLMVVACPMARGKLVSQTNLCYSHQNDCDYNLEMTACVFSRHALDWVLDYTLLLYNCGVKNTTNVVGLCQDARLLTSLEIFCRYCKAASKARGRYEIVTSIAVPKLDTIHSIRWLTRS